MKSSIKNFLKLATLGASLVFAVLWLTGCGPIYRTSNEYVPPHSKIGNMCAIQCQNNKNMCQQMCSMKNENCIARAHQDAIYQFKVYKQERQRHGKPIKKSIKDFESSFGCYANCDCDHSFDVCYASCGGEIIPHKRCIAFCGN